MKNMSRWFWLGCLLVTAGWGMPRLADAQANYGCDQTNWVPVSFQLPSQITIPSNPTYGSVLWTSPSTPTTGTAATLTCKGPPKSGVQNHISGNPPGGTIFDTYIPGLAYQVIRSDTGTPLQLYPNEPMPSGNNFSAITYRLQLVWTGPIAAQSLGAYELSAWNVGVNNGDSFGFQVVDFQTKGSAGIAPAACDVASSTTSVSLPTVTTSGFSAVGSTSGTTPFAIKLSCASSAKVAVTLSANQPVAPSVLANSGTAAGIGVQLLYQSYPITFDNPIALGSIGPGTVSIPFTARYYRTGNVKAGSVTATATYTLTYP